MRALIVGAGAVGQVFGRHLALGGAEVAFFVKDKYAAEARAGFRLYPLNQKRHPAHRLDGAGVVTTMAEVAAQRWDQVYLTVSSTAIRVGTWLGELCAATGDATIVFLQPNLDDRALLLAHCDGARVVDGTIGFLSYHAPLPGEARFTEPGMAYWFPPMAPSPFSGAEPRVRGVLDALRAGKFPAKRVRDLSQTAPFPSAVLNAYVAALEGAGWSFATLRRDGYLAAGARAARQMLAIAAREVGAKAPLGVRLAARPTTMRVVLRVQRAIVPLDLEAFFKAHFTKVGAQTRLGLRRYLALGKKHGLPVDAIAQLVAYLGT